MLHAAASRGLDLDAFVVRKAAKDHGMRRRIEGPDVAGRSVVVLEDTSTTGGSPLEAVEALREAGADVRAVAVIVDRATGARERIEAAGLPYYAACSMAAATGSAPMVRPPTASMSSVPRPASSSMSSMTWPMRGAAS